MSLTKSEFLQPVEIHGPFAVDGLGDVYVREVPFSDASFVYANQSEDTFDTSLRMVVVSVCDESGQLVFSPDDYEALRNVPAIRIQKLMQLVTEHSGFGADVEDIAGN